MPPHLTRFVLRARLAALLTGVMLVSVSMAGCDRGAAALALDKAAARQALTTFLQSWKSGENLASLQSKSPSIIGRDPDWEAGQELVDFQLGEETDDGTNLHIQATLTVRAGTASAAPQSVRYTVGTSPVITIQRAD